MMENIKSVAKFDLPPSAKRRRTSETTWTLCLLCQLETAESVSEPKRKESYEKLYNCITERATWNDLNFVELKMCLGELTATDFEVNKAKWHRSCYQNATHKGHMERAHRMFIEQSRSSIECQQECSSSLHLPYTRAKTSVYVKSVCIFCDNGPTNHNKLHLVQTDIAGEKLLKAVELSNDDRLRVRVNESLNPADAHAIDVMYHKNCWNTNVNNKLRQVNVPYQKQDKFVEASDIEFINSLRDFLEQGHVSMAELENVYKNICLTNGVPESEVKSRRQIKKLIEEQLLEFDVLFSSPKRKNESERVSLKAVKDVAMAQAEDENVGENLRNLYSAAKCIRKLALGAKNWNFEGSLLQDNVDDIVPMEMYYFFKWCLVGQVDMSHVNASKSSEVNNRAVRLSQSLMYECMSSRQVAKKDSQLSRHIHDVPVPLAVGIAVHKESRSKKLIKILNGFGCCVDYHRILQLEDQIVGEVLHRMEKNDGVYIPPDLTIGRFIFCAADNIDFQEDTRDGKQTLHGTVMVVYQEMQEDDTSVPLVLTGKSHSESGRKISYSKQEAVHLRSKQLKPSMPLLNAELNTNMYTVARSPIPVVDQSGSSSWWQDAQVLGDGAPSGSFFTSTHGLVQTHPAGSADFKSFDFGNRATEELRRNPSLTPADECARACRENEPPRICYYHFTLELYNVLGAACQVCVPNATNTVWSHCQCVLADGVERGLLTANRMLPGPSIQVCENDKVVIDVENAMDGLEVTIHWHGVWQKGSQYSDGVPFVTQCPIQQGNTFRYQWRADNAGTHFWHAHTGLQKLDGLYGSIVVRQAPSRDPNSHLYDYDLTTHVVLLSDWMHEDAQERFPGRLAVNPGQNPDTLLINGKGQFQDRNTGFITNTPLEVFTMTPGRRYRFRLINSLASVCPAQLTIQDHDLILIATDGEAIHPVVVNTIISFSGERYDFVINAEQPVGAYWIQARGLGECGEGRVQQLGVLRYARGPHEPLMDPPTYDVGLPQGVVLNPLDAVCDRQRSDAVCVNQLKNAQHIDKGILQERPDVKIFLPFRFLFYRPEQLFVPNTYNRYLVAPSGDHVISLVDEISFVFPPAPPLSQIDDLPPEQFCNGDNRPPDCGTNCMCTHKVDIPLNAVVEVVLVDEVQQPNLSHPFHLHGQAFNVIGMGRSPDTNVKKINLKHALDLDRRGLLHRQFNLPPGKDTIAVPNNGYVVLRFRASNPGYWLFHCHFLFHIVIGMNVVFHVGTHADLPPVPQGFPTCGNFLPPISLH